MITLSLKGAKRKIEDRKQDLRAKALENNPCSLCKTFGLTSCRGHGESSASNGDEGKLSIKDPADLYESEGSFSLNLKTSSREKRNALSSFLEASELWHELLKEDLLYLFDNDLALLSLSLNLSQGLIIFKENKLLNTDEQKDLAILYDAINTEFNQFKKELSNQITKLNGSLVRHNNHLIITIPVVSNSNQYDTFIARLIDKNLIPTKKNQIELERTMKKGDILIDQEFKAGLSTSPTAFDVFRG